MQVKVKFVCTEQSEWEGKKRDHMKGVDPENGQIFEVDNDGLPHKFGDDCVFSGRVVYGNRDRVFLVTEKKK